MKQINKDLEELENGEIPESMNYTINPVIDETNFIYKTITEEYYIEKCDPILISMFPSLMSIVKEEYEKNKHRTPLEEMLKLQNDKNKLIIENNLTINKENNDEENRKSTTTYDV